MVNNTTNIKNHLSPSMYCLTCERILKHHLHSQWCWIHSQHLLSYTVITRLCGGNAETRPWVCVKKTCWYRDTKTRQWGLDCGQKVTTQTTWPPRVCMSDILISEYFTNIISFLELWPDFGSITFRCNRLHYNYFAIFMITLHYDYINFQM